MVVTYESRQSPREPWTTDNGTGKIGSTLSETSVHRSMWFWLQFIYPRTCPYFKIRFNLLGVAAPRFIVDNKVKRLPFCYEDIQNNADIGLFFLLFQELFPTLLLKINLIQLSFLGSLGSLHKNDLLGHDICGVLEFVIRSWKPLDTVLRVVDAPTIVARWPMQRCVRRFASRKRILGWKYTIKYVPCVRGQGNDGSLRCHRFLCVYFATSFGKFIAASVKLLTSHNVSFYFYLVSI